MILDKIRQVNKLLDRIEYSGELDADLLDRFFALRNEFDEIRNQYEIRNSPHFKNHLRETLSAMNKALLIG